MCTQAIPHDNERAPQMLMHFTHEADEVFRAGVVIQEFAQYSPNRAAHGARVDRSHRRDPIVSAPDRAGSVCGPAEPRPAAAAVAAETRFHREIPTSLPLKALFLVAARSRDASGRSPFEIRDADTGQLDPSSIEEWVFYDHPSPRNRISPRCGGARSTCQSE